MDDPPYGIENVPPPPRSGTLRERLREDFEQAWPQVGWVIFAVWFVHRANHWRTGRPGPLLLALPALLMIWWAADLWRYHIRGWQALLCFCIATIVLAVTAAGWVPAHWGLLAAIAWVSYWVWFREH